MNALPQCDRSRIPSLVKWAYLLGTDLRWSGWLHWKAHRCSAISSLFCVHSAGSLCRGCGLIKTGHQLSPREKDKLLIAMAAMVARRRLDRGVKLNHP
jgi:hypothetical protein